MWLIPETWARSTSGAPSIQGQMWPGTEGLREWPRIFFEGIGALHEPYPKRDGYIKQWHELKTIAEQRPVLTVCRTSSECFQHLTILSRDVSSLSQLPARSYRHGVVVMTSSDWDTWPASFWPPAPLQTCPFLCLFLSLSPVPTFPFQPNYTFYAKR